MSNPTKICSLCKKEHCTIYFYTVKKNKDGLHAWCKYCCKAHEKARYEQLKAARIAQVKEWQAANQDKVKEYKKNWRARTDSPDAPPVE